MTEETSSEVARGETLKFIFFNLMRKLILLKLKKLKFLKLKIN
jgi:hypothetical protein